MRAIRCHVEAPLAPGRDVVLPESARTHLTRVLRLRAGDAVILFNGDGHDYPAVLAGAGPALVAQVSARSAPAAAEARLALTLVQALARGEKMDWIIQKATEIGVARIVPVTSQRSEVKLDGERAARRLAHWRAVAASACEQCGRARVPAVEPPQPLHAALPALAGTPGLVLDPSGTGVEAAVLAARWSDAGAVALAIGPEGGFDGPELDGFDRAGWQRLRLGERILRTETAGVVAATVLLTLAGEYGP
jgi:16S rRNA (uracil1498-N3)-methyltransferase